LAIANEGPNTFGGMMTRLLASQLGIQINAVPYVSSSKAVLDTVAGQIEVIFSPVISVTQMASAGKLRPLGVTTAKRVVGWETVPAIAETVPGFDFAGWIAVVAPAGTPAAAIQRFNRDLDAVLTDKEFAARLLTMGPITEGAGTPDQMKTFLEEEHARWAKLAKEIGVLPE
jgi:tripartite-type tricarboxylate transporter receptor subunit TctC